MKQNELFKLNVGDKVLEKSLSDISPERERKITKITDKFIWCGQTRYSKRTRLSIGTCIPYILSGVKK